MPEEKIMRNSNTVPRGTGATKTVGIMLSIVLSFLTIWNFMGDRIDDIITAQNNYHIAHEKAHTQLYNEMDDLLHELGDIKINMEDRKVQKYKLENVEHVNAQEASESREERHLLESQDRDHSTAITRLEEQVKTIQNRIEILHP
jgi:hypothetical protein